MHNLTGFNDTDARAARVLELEHALALQHPSLADNQDIQKANNTWTQADFKAKARGLDWDEYFASAGLGKIESFIVWQPEAFTGQSALVAATSPENWKAWLACHLLEAPRDAS